MHKLSLNKKTILIGIGSFLIFVLVFSIALMVGKYRISFKAFFGAISGASGYEIEQSIILNLRLPRTIIAALTGIALSVSGLLYQETFQNKLVSPDLLGVSSGSGVGAAIAIIIGLPAFAISSFSFIFGVGTVILTLTVAKLFKNRSSVMLVLAGIIVGGLASAILSFIKYLADAETTLASITFWLMGSFEHSKMTDVYILAPIVAICVIIVLCISWRINIVALGREEAQTKGLHYNRYRFLIIGIATLLTASSVAFSGTIGWIGLVVPHIARLAVGGNTKRTIPLSIGFGSIFMVLTDIISRTFTASEIPISAITGLFGTVLFIIILIIRRKTINEND